MRSRAVVPLLALTLLGACLGARQLLAETVMVATLLATPEVVVTDQAFSPDGGVGSADAGITIPGQTVAFAFLGQREEGALDQAPSAVEGATVTVRPANGAAQPLEEDADGRYQLTSAAAPGLQYVSLETYEFQATLEEEQYTARVEEVPPVETIPELHPAQGFTLLDAGAPFTLNRPPPPAGVERPLGFVTVFELGANGSLGDVTWTNLPDAPLEVLNLVARPANWRRTEVVIPAEAFPSAAANYLVTFQAAKLGGPTSPNLFVGSAILAGMADVGVVRTR